MKCRPIQLQLFLEAIAGYSKAARDSCQWLCTDGTHAILPGPNARLHHTQIKLILIPRAAYSFSRLKKAKVNVCFYLCLYCQESNENALICDFFLLKCFPGKHTTE